MDESPKSISHRYRPRQRRGQSLVEFAVIALVVYMLLAAILTFGFMFYAVQGTQAAVDLAARETSRTPLPANSVTLEMVLYGDYTDPALGLSAADQEAIRRFRQTVYDEHYLVIELPTDGPATELSTRWRELVARLPLVNQQLVPLMIPDSFNDVDVLRYPGAVYEDDNPDDNPDPSVMPEPSGFLVRIPIVVGRSATGVETIDWVAAVEPIVREAGPRIDPFKVSSPERGIVGLRINYPSQSPAMSSFRHDTADPEFPFEPTVGRPNLANDAGVVVVTNPIAPPDGPLVSPDQGNIHRTTYSGEYGLGGQQALGQVVRPYRRVISSQAIFRREILQ